MNKRTLFSVVAVALLAAGCGGKRATLPAMNDTSTEVPAASNDSSSGAGMDDSSIRSRGFAEDDVATDTADALIIYFEYDRAEVRPEYADLLAAHARRLSNDRGLRLRLEGHADERGSREYNIGLGERRAQAVRRLLLIQGASAGQISTVSYGEERPVAFGSTESDYEKNRRVELSYR